MWQVAQAQAPPHSASMPGTELRSAVSMTAAPTCASTVRDCPVASMKVIFAIKQSGSLEYRITPRKRVNSVGDRGYIERAYIEQAQRPRKSIRRIPRGRPDSRTERSYIAVRSSRLASKTVDFRESLGDCRLERGDRGGFRRALIAGGRGQFLDAPCGAGDAPSAHGKRRATQRVSDFCLC